MRKLLRRNSLETHAVRDAGRFAAQTVHQAGGLKKSIDLLNGRVTGYLFRRHLGLGRGGHLALILLGLWIDGGDDHPESMWACLPAGPLERH